jgi:hypothetical protein
MHRVGKAYVRPQTAGRFRYVFVLTYGRSGSTLLMALLNTIPGYRINGENYNALYRLHQAVAAIDKAYQLASGRRSVPTDAWFGMPRARPDRFRQDLLDSFVTNVLRPEAGDRVLGFKEIRFSESHMDDLDAYLDFVRRAFPGCKLIFNHRDPAAVARSGWWSGVRDAEQRIKAADARLSAIPADERHFHFRYDDIDDSLDNIRELFRFLGEELDEQRVRGVLGTYHGPRLS